MENFQAEKDKSRWQTIKRKNGREQQMFQSKRAEISKLWRLEKFNHGRFSTPILLQIASFRAANLVDWLLVTAGSVFEPMYTA